MSTHQHDWDDVATWGIAQLAEHWVAEHNTTTLRPVTVEEILTYAVTDSATRRDHQILHVHRDDGSSPATGQLDLWLRTFNPTIEEFR